MKIKPLLFAFFIAAVFAFSGCAVTPQAAENGQAAGQIATVHNSRDSLDWWGLYQGVAPAASGMGIQKQLMIQYDGFFVLTFEHLFGDMPVPEIGRSFTWSDRFQRVIGTIEWNEAGSIIRLAGLPPEMPPYYLVGEGVLVQLDMQGNPVEGDFAGRNILTRVRLPLHEEMNL